MNPDHILSNLSLDPLPAGWTPIGVVALVKCIDDEGEETWAFRTSEELSHEEALGAMVIRVELAKAWAVDAWTADE